AAPASLPRSCRRSPVAAGGKRRNTALEHGKPGREAIQDESIWHINRTKAKPDLRSTVMSLLGMPQRFCTLYRGPIRFGLYPPASVLRGEGQTMSHQALVRPASRP